ncbi:MAG: alcohol dehydrogenase catalytic domain-containing protein [Spirochaetaceae bacterium]|nr:MAG: alcohol dehydrogenase catalytic domain-containing protein [Spirochaetaceae bacterium]
MDTSLAVILERPGSISVKKIPIPPIQGPTVRVRMQACGICGSDVRYFSGENPWSLHTLGRHVPSPPNMVLGHEVSGIAKSPEGETPVAILDKSGTLVLLAVHQKLTPLAPIWFSGERRIMSSANNNYRDFPRAIELMASGAIKVKSLITHSFTLRQAPKAFQVMLNKDREQAYKVILYPELP